MPSPHRLPAGGPSPAVSHQDDPDAIHSRILLPKRLIIPNEPVLTIIRSMELEYDDPGDRGHATDNSINSVMPSPDNNQGDDALLVNANPEMTTKRFSLTSLTRRQMGLIAVMFIVNYCNFVCYSLIAPFFPKEAVNKGGSQALASWIFGSYELTVFLICPLIGKYIRILGPRFLFVTGTFVTGTACVLFGMLSMVEDYKAFVSLAFCIRIIEAMGAGAYLTASFCIAATEFPSIVATVQGVLETASGLGISTGPTIGGALYTAGGYWLPFATVGGILVISGLLSLWILPVSASTVVTRSPHSLWSMLKIPGIFLSSMAVICGAMTIGFYEPTLELHIDKFLASPFQVGLVFLASAGTYALGSPIWGAVADRIRHPKLLTICGCVIVSGAFLLMGPVPFLGLKPQLWLVILALLIHGIGIGAQLVPPLRDILTEALKNGFPDDVDTRGLASGLFASMFSLGAFLGPMIGGSLIDVISFEWSAFLISCVNLMLAIVLTFYMLHEYLKVRRARNVYRFIPTGNDDLMEDA